MWREYLGLAGTAIAVVNGLLAIAVALLPVRRSVAKLRLGVAAVVLAVLAAGAAYYGKHSARLQQERQLAERGEIRERIETLMLEGRTLLGQIRDPQRELPNRAADEWAQRSEIYLREKLGERYVMRFRKDVNGMYGDAPVPAARLGYWRAVRNRVVNLEMMSSEFPEPPPAESATASTQ
jgi:hypothetical protein